MADAYRGRFAPSPTGPLHAGSLVAALASWLDARAHAGVWIVRIEDVDTVRCRPEHARGILATLARFGMESDVPVVWQSDRSELYQAALDKLLSRGLAFGCACTRRETERAAAAQGLPPGVYPGTCRRGTKGRPARAIRLLTAGAGRIAFTDRWAGPFCQDVEREVGDFVIRRADGLWAYQLACVVDDGEQGVSDVVRGADLLDNTPRQILLQDALGLPHPRMMHVPLVRAADGSKLSKQTKAAPVDGQPPLRALESAWAFLGFPRIGAARVPAFLAAATDLWRERFPD